MFLMRFLDQNEFCYIRNNLAHQIKTKVSLEVIRDKSPEDLFGKEIAKRVIINYRKCLEKKTSITYEETLNLPGGQRIWLTTLTPVIEENLVKYIVGSSTDITERKILEMKLEEQANYDKLTGLPNRRLFFDRLNQMIFENQRDNSSFALAFIDLDGFKAINDTYGHEIGDEVLIIISERLSSCIRKSDTTARMGGDEFTMILRHVKEKRDLEKLVHKILKAISKEMTIEDISCFLSASIGIFLYPDHGEDSESLLRSADRAMYDIKKHGKSGFKI
jgi:histidinol-phosphatase (PHP family)